MKTSFLDYYKLILSKVSFDQGLLRKEYSKALNTLKPAEVQELNRWCRENRLLSAGVSEDTVLMAGDYADQALQTRF